jgi:RoxA-like, cytochrome c-like
VRRKCGLSTAQWARGAPRHRSAYAWATGGCHSRPLNGIWATPPYLHNGSIPNLYEVLSPQDERPDRFWLGSRLFDPDSVGFASDSSAGGFELDTSLPGNSNKGHLFDDDPTAKGVIGPRLEETERWDIIEYLKQLPPLPSRP